MGVGRGIKRGGRERERDRKFLDANSRKGWRDILVQMKLIGPGR